MQKTSESGLSLITDAHFPIRLVGEMKVRAVDQKVVLAVASYMCHSQGGRGGETLPTLAKSVK